MTARLLFACLVISSIQPSTVRAGLPDDRAIIPGYERFRSTHLSSVEAGRLLLSELNCTSCHAAKDLTAIPQRSAPILTDVASRIQPEHLLEYISDPAEVKPGTAMPSVLHGPKANHQAKAIAHFLNQNSTAVPVAVSTEAIKKGEALFHSLGCAACHGDRRESASELPEFAMPLGTLHEKYTLPSLTKFLMNPHAVRPSGRMPGLNLTNQEADFISSWLLRETDAEPVMEYEYFEGNWDSLPDFDSLEPRNTGYANTVSVAAAERGNSFGLRFHSNLHLKDSGEYQFWLRSDDGSRLLIDGEEVIRNDGIHPASTQNAKRTLQAGAHKIVVEYFEGGGEEELSLEFQGPGITRQSPTAFLSLSAEPRSANPVFRTEPALVKEGASLFVSTGCASCHQHDAVEKPDSLSAAKSLAEINTQANTGCLTRDSHVPRFQLSDQQITDLKAALADIQQSSQASTKEQMVHSTLLTLNCYACHSRGDIGGSSSELNHVFQGTVPEMGDEARIPPTLTNVGDKLQTTWMAKVLNEGAKNRPYMKTRMPRFGSQNVGQLVQQFAELDQKTEIPDVEYTEPEHRITAAGRYMVGGQALGCIKCHTFGKYEATGIQSLDMLTMPQRLRRDWFHRYLVDPQKYRKGTRMPAAWPNGKSILKNVLDRNTLQQIQAIWDYLEQGDKAAIPYGLEKQAIVLAPKDRPIIYRNFIAGLSPRGIAVGHPEKVHYAWDAHDMNVRLIWHNQFIDASKHWVGRGPGFQTPLGDHVMTLTDGIPLAVLESLDQPWPEGSGRDSGFQFLGYSLDDSGRPAFRYQFAGITVTDSLVPVESEPDAALQRRLSMTATEVPEGTLYLRVAAGDKADQVDSGIRIDSVTYKGLKAANLRKSPQTELLVPVKWDTDGKATISYQISW